MLTVQLLLLRCIPINVVFTAVSVTRLLFVSTQNSSKECSQVTDPCECKNINDNSMFFLYWTRNELNQLCYTTLINTAFDTLCITKTELKIAATH